MSNAVVRVIKRFTMVTAGSSCLLKLTKEVYVNTYDLPVSVKAGQEDPSKRSCRDGKEGNIPLLLCNFLFG